MAAVTHLPAVLAAALVDTVSGQQSWSDLQQMAGGAFAAVTRLAARDPQLTTDLMAADRGAILDWIGRFQERLQALAVQLETGEGLKETVMRAHRARLQWDRDRQRPATARFPAPDLPTSSGLMQHIMFGRLAERLRRRIGNRHDDR